MGKLKYSLDNAFQHLNVKCWTARVRGVSKSFSKSGHGSFLASFLWGPLTLTMLRQPVTQYANDTGPWCKPLGLKFELRFKKLWTGQTETLFCALRGNYLSPGLHSIQIFAEVHFLQFSLHLRHMLASGKETKESNLKCSVIVSWLNLIRCWRVRGLCV